MPSLCDVVDLDIPANLIPGESLAEALVRSIDPNAIKASSGMTN
jgi:hypothetical protein